MQQSPLTYIDKGRKHELRKEEGINRPLRQPESTEMVSGEGPTGTVEQSSERQALVNKQWSL